MKNRKKTAVIIAAAGSGKRMGGGIPKLYRKLGGVPVLVRTLLQFEAHPLVDEICVVTREDDVRSCRCEFVEPYGISKVSAVVAGGAERQDSVGRALAALSDEVDYVLVQDGARPFVTERVITEVIEALSQYPGAIAAVPSKDTIKRGENGVAVETPDRSTLFAVQTPQGFRRPVLERAYREAAEDEFYGTDDSVLVERIGETVYLVKGDYHNIKITTTEDLIMGEAILEEERLRDGEGPGRRPAGPVRSIPDFRTGSGFDVHAFAAGRKLILGGVEIPHERGLQGHSDADVLTHAVMDALLGACGLGDIGRHFPDNDPQYKGISSLTLLSQVWKLVKEQGFGLGNLDATVIAQKPKLAPYLEEMIGILAEVLELPPEERGRINLKATTTERLGFTGREEGIAAQAVVLLSR